MKPSGSTRKPRPTLADVAAGVGLSKAMVSQILNGKGRASAETRAAVIALAEKIGYGADPVARSLRTGRTGVLGLVFRPRDAVSGSLIGTEYYVRVAGGAAAWALSKGYGLLHLPDPTRIGEAYAMDGCIVVSPYANDPILDTLGRRGLPVVLIDPDPDHLDRGIWIGRADTEATTNLLVHMHTAGAERFLLLSTTDDNAWKRNIQSAFRAWCKVGDRESWIIEVDSSLGSEGARDATRRLLEAGSLPDAIIGSTSRFATGAVEAAMERGLVVPKDLLVATLSDGELTRRHSPAITALDLHGEQAGKEAVARLIRLVDGDELPSSVAINPTLLVRDSTVSRRSFGDIERGA